MTARTDIRLSLRMKYCLLFAVPFLIYLQVVSFDFSFHDDDIMILESADKLRTFGIDDFLFTDAWMRKAEIELYRPLQSMTYALDYRIAGIKPGIYHLHNLVVFCFSVLLIFTLLLRIGFQETLAFWLSLFYAVHHLMVHVVCWIPARGDVYLVFWGMSGLLAFHHGWKHGKITWIIVAVLCYFFALLSKESAVTLPLLMLLWGWYEGQWKRRHRVIVFAILLLGLVTAAYFMLRHDAVLRTEFVGLSSLKYNAPTLPEEVFKFYIPAFFSVMPGFKTPVTLIGVGIIGGLALLTWWLRKKIYLGRIMLGIAFFLITLLPSVMYKPVFAGYAYDYIDHRMFMNGIGLLIFTGEWVRFSIGAFGLRAWTAFLAMIILQAAMTVHYAGVYKDFETYYQNAVTTNPRSGFALYNYAILLSARKQQYDEAMYWLDKAAALYPREYMYQKGKATVAYQMGDFESMARIAENMISSWPHVHFGYLFMGMYHLHHSNYEDAVHFLSRAIERNPNDADGYANRAKAFQALGNHAAAIKDWDKVIEMNPHYAEAYYERGNLYGNLQDYKKALSDYDRYVSLRPQDPRGYFYRGQAYCLIGKKDWGYRDLQKAALLNAGDDAQIMRVARQLCR
ncbi:MAG: hypothetical protein KatS3mg031_2721 [Chitinophagales bacterium]|nr:MAG: hypothetical protein KatS3mg031_2721 [Chitinophagales bacterium]